MYPILLLSMLLYPCWAQLDSRTIMQYLKDQNMSKLVGFLAGTNLDTVLGNKDAPAMTLFAPTEAAWDKIPPNILASLVLDTAKLKDALLGHLVDQVVFGSYIRDKDAKTNFLGDPMDFRVFKNGERTVNGAQLIGSDVSLANGVVHMINSVILPTEISIGEYVAQNTDRFADLFGLLVVGRLFGTLETSGSFTLFAPSDSAFEAITANITTLISDRDAVSKLLQYHVVPDTFWSVGLADGMTLPTVNGGNITVVMTNGSVMINDAMVTVADIRLSNGVIHVIDKVISPPAS